MLGMDRATGKRLAGNAHLAQSVGDILNTPIGSRVVRRDYGSTLFELVDQPMNALGRLRIFAATADALRKWETRIRVTRVALVGDAASFVAGVFSLDIEGETDEGPAPTGLVRLTIPLLPVNA